ncbi:MAG: hypothetical protein BWY62_01277 [Firmicutes bacterium ADurb.Bin356]|nr:MAG: hypothetical protein BWY62_01277 [Firmicutes bacterium ADurb.Bin356]
MGFIYYVDFVAQLKRGETGFFKEKAHLLNSSVRSGIQFDNVDIIFAIAMAVLAFSAGLTIVRR